MPRRIFTKTFKFQQTSGPILNFRADTEYLVPEEVAEFADKNGFTKKIEAAPENKNLGDAPENRSTQESKNQSVERSENNLQANPPKRKRGRPRKNT